MKLMTLRSGSCGHAGIGIEDEVLDLVSCADVIVGARLLPAAWIDILAAGDEGLGLVKRIVDRVQATPSIADLLRELGALKPYGEANIAAPIPRPRLILSCGINYRAHLSEFGAALPTRPGAFIKYSGSVVGTGDPIILPRSNPDLVDYEGEFCFVFGSPCHEVSEAEALGYVLGYTLTNDVSARDWAMAIGKAKNATEATQAVMSNTLGKSFPSFAPLGPMIVTKDEIKDPHAVSFQTLLNGEVMQNGSTSDFIFSIPWLIAEYSKHFLFMPGDIVTTGSPPGVGLARTPPVFLRAGDRIEISSPQIGTLCNPVLAAE